MRPVTLTIFCTTCRKETRAEKVGMKEAELRLSLLGRASEVRGSRRDQFWNRCEACGSLYAAPPPGK